MSRNIQRHREALLFLNKASPRVAKAILNSSANNGLINAISECACNVLKGHVPLSPKQKRRLARYKKDLRSFVSKKTKQSSRRRIVQKGGFLGALLGPLASILGGVIGSLTGGR